ncbi:SMP-30/gluconolactonase/LRE family protein [Gryllotalpicola reticulitermitis]|uniref:SMP-30/gluconolactonase/LRE family protein n=1 Tax=Gryllotalpicola reticulitermitis TaxID=1184153 RepID=A0ABV8Q4F9_9MICO
MTWHGEGPCWDPVGERMLVVDLSAGAVVDVTAPSDPVRHQLRSGVAAVVRPRRGGGFLVAGKHGFDLFDADFQFERELAHVLDDPAVRLNEGGCDAAGRFFCGGMAYAGTPAAASVYRLEPDGATSVAFDGVTISNGLQWSLDGTRAFYIDTPTHRVDVFDYDVADGTFHDRRTFAELSGVSGSPDGMTIDAEGGLWVAFWGGGVVRRLDPESGAVTEEVEVSGAAQTSACAFGGESLDTLYITTSRQDLPDDVDPAAGAVFAVRPGTRGTPLPQFAG